MANATDLPPWPLLRLIIGSRSRDFAFTEAVTPDILDDWLVFDIGDRLDRTHPLVEHPPDDVRLVIEGYTETIQHRSWSAQLNGEPFDPWRIAIVDDPAAIQDVPRIGSATATLAVGINTTAVSLSVTTGAGGLWTTLPADFPLDINVGGERIRLSGISGGSSPQTFTVAARSQNGVVKSHLAGASIEVWQIATVGL